MSFLTWLEWKWYVWGLILCFLSTQEFGFDMRFFFLMVVFVEVISDLLDVPMIWCVYCSHLLLSTCRQHVIGTHIWIFRTFSISQDWIICLFAIGLYFSFCFGDLLLTHKDSVVTTARLLQLRLEVSETRQSHSVEIHIFKKWCSRSSNYPCMIIS